MRTFGDERNGLDRVLVIHGWHSADRSKAIWLAEQIAAHGNFVAVASIGTALYGARFDDLITVGWVPGGYSPVPEGADPEVYNERIETWWERMVLCRFGPNSWLNPPNGS